MLVGRFVTFALNMPCLKLWHTSRLHVWTYKWCDINVTWRTVSLLSYLDKPYQRQRCRDVAFPPRHRWRRGCRAPENFLGPSKCRRCTPRTPCRGQTHSCTTCPGLQDIWCRVHTAVRFHSYNSHSCTHRWRRWSLCRALSCGADLCILCRADISLCD